MTEQNTLNTVGSIFGEKAKDTVYYTELPSRTYQLYEKKNKKLLSVTREIMAANKISG